MIALAWRQHRSQATATTGLLAVLAVLLLWTGHQMSDYLRVSGLSTCLDGGGDCHDLVGLFQQRYGRLLDYSPYLNFLPVLVGIFWGAPLVARELEQGTHRLVWTQSITRRRWLLTRLALLLTTAVVASYACTLLLTWWFRHFARLGNDGGMPRMSPNVFDFEGIVPIGYTVFALALGTVTGVLLRRTLPAMAVTLLGWLPLRLYVQHLREHFQAPLRLLTEGFVKAPGTGRSDWVISQDIVDGQGHALGDGTVFATCPPDLGGTGIRDCLVGHDFRTLVVYQPGSRFWTFQLIETGLYVGLTLLLLGVAVHWVTRRTA